MENSLHQLQSEFLRNRFQLLLANAIGVATLLSTTGNGMGYYQNGLMIWCLSTNSRLLATSKLTDEKRWHAENLDLENPQLHESDDPENSDDSSTDGITAYDVQHLYDDIDSGTFATDKIPSASINEHAFENTDDLEDKVDTFLPTAQLLNADGRVNPPTMSHPLQVPPI